MLPFQGYFWGKNVATLDNGNQRSDCMFREVILISSGRKKTLKSRLAVQGLTFVLRVRSTQFDFCRLKPLPDDKIFDMTKLKVFADDTLDIANTTIPLQERVENNVVKGENAGYQHFLLFQQRFPKPSSLGSLKVEIVWLRVKPLLHNLLLLLVIILERIIANFNTAVDFPHPSDDHEVKTTECLKKHRRHLQQVSSLLYHQYFAVI